jgi:hypothetical protein
LILGLLVIPAARAVRSVLDRSGARPLRSSLVTTRTATSFPAFAGRLCWMIVGPFALGVCAISIAGRRDGWLSLIDVIYFVVLAGMLVGRWTEFRSGAPLTAIGEPAMPDDLRRYAVALGLIGLGAWVVANLIGNRGSGFLG